MAIYEVTYRGGDGTLKTAEVEAGDRKRLFDTLKRKGIVPTGVKEASRRAVSPGGGRPRAALVAVGAAAALLVAAILWRAASGRSAAPSSPAGNAAGRAAGGRGTAQSAGAMPRAEAASRPAKQGGAKSASPAAHAAVSAPAGHPQGAPRGKGLAAVPPPETLPGPPARGSGETPLFTNPVHAELAGYALPGRDLPPPERVSDEEALKAAETPIAYGPEDTEETLAQKQAVAEMLAELKAYLAQGGHATEFFEKLHERQSEEGKTVAAVRQNVNALLDAGDAETAVAALDEYNRNLQERGIPPVRIKRLERARRGVPRR